VTSSGAHPATAEVVPRADSVVIACTSPTSVVRPWVSRRSLVRAERPGVVAREYNFAQIVEAHAAMEASGASGKLVVIA
jgi:hypothetical protein